MAFFIQKIATEINTTQIFPISQPFYGHQQPS